MIFKNNYQLEPESVPVFGYPFVNYSPNDRGDERTSFSDKLWQVFSKSIIFQANTSNNDSDKKLLLA